MYVLMYVHLLIFIYIHTPLLCVWMYFQKLGNVLYANINQPTKLKNSKLLGLFCCTATVSNIPTYKVFHFEA